MIRMVVRENGIPDWTIGQRLDLRHQVVVHPLVFGVNEHDTVVGDDDRRIAAVLPDFRDEVIDVLNDEHIIAHPDERRSGPVPERPEDPRRVPDAGLRTEVGGLS